ncbi:MAG: glycosyltransferase family 4 protein [Chloroflexi bacterium]|nr:glycosyltransferase family 4 protein [Chloroflexota bacterium]
MRIGLVIYGALDTLSGGYLYDRMLVAHLRACGDDVQIYSLPWRNYARHCADNVSTAFARRMCDATVDVWLQDELNHPSLLRANALLRRMRDRAPIVSIVHHLRVSETHSSALLAMYRVVERAYLRSCDAFVFNSNATRASVHALVGAGRAHVVAYPAADHLPVFVREESTTGALRLLAVGNLIERKGLHTTLTALRDVCGDWTLDVIGRDDVDPAYAARCRHIANVAGFGARVRWRGRLDDAELARCYASADALVAPSQYEGFGIVYLEAMAAGLPVIASTAGAAGEIVYDDVEGYLVPPENPAATAAAIQRLFDPEQRRRLGRAACARGAAHPRWVDSAAAIRSFLVERVERVESMGERVNDRR